MLDTQDTPTLDALRSLRQEIFDIATARGARNIRVFGSVARGEAHPDSDVDLLVDMDSERSALDLSELILDLEEMLRRRVDIVEIRRPSTHTEQILREAVAL